MTTQYDDQRARRIPPHAPLRALRLVSGMTLADVAIRATAYLQASDLPDGSRGRTITEGALSAIELGHRGPSVDTLRALEHAYGLDPYTLTTTHTPRQRKARESVNV